jgi:RNA polymerase sigma factor (sigma-70 family)
VTDAVPEDVWRGRAPQVLGALLRRYGNFDAAEDAVQEALLAASVQWPAEGTPDNPTAWLIRVASRRLIDRQRSDRARADREQAAATQVPADELYSAAADGEDSHARDDTVLLLLLCCHPALTRASQVALSLRAVGGLTTAQIARAFLVPESTMVQRISRAKARLREVDARFTLPAREELPDRMASLQHVLYLIFNEGYTSTGGATLYDVSLTGEAIRLTRQLHQQLPDSAEVAGLLALMLLTDARRAARAHADGSLVPLARQNRARWDRAAITEGTRLLETVLTRGHVGPYRLQAAIAAVHSEAKSWEETDWMQIVVLYRMLDDIAPSPAVTLNLAVAVAMAHSPDAGLRMLDPLLDDPRTRRNHRIHAVRAHLLEMTGRNVEAGAAYAAAARLTTSIPEQRYLNSKAAQLNR